jgi:hypothetical protein
MANPPKNNRGREAAMVDYPDHVPDEVVNEISDDIESYLDDWEKGVRAHIKEHGLEGSGDAGDAE